MDLAHSENKENHVEDQKKTRKIHKKPELEAEGSAPSSGGVLALSQLKVLREQKSHNFRSPRSPPPRDESAKRMKCVLVGDSLVGKSALVTSFMFEGEFSHTHCSTVREDYAFSGPLGGEKMDVEEDLDITDTGGEAYLDRLRPLCYPDMDVVLICFSVVVPSSFANVTKRWVPELKRYRPNLEAGGLQIILVGTQSDLRSNMNTLLQLMEDGLVPISETKAIRLAKKIGAVKYIECSSLTGNNVKKVFHTAWNSPRLYRLQQQAIAETLKLKTTTKKPAVKEEVPAPQPVTPPPSPSPQGKKILNPQVRTTTQTCTSTNLFWKRWRFVQKTGKIKRLVLSCV